MKSIIFLGAGGHAKVLLEIALLLNEKIKGFALPYKSEDTEVLGFPIIGTDEDVLTLSPQENILVNGLGSTISLELRAAIYSKFKEHGFSFKTLIHPGATVSKQVCIGEGAQIMAGVVVQTGCILEANCIINTRASIDHDCHIGNSAHIAPGATLSGGVKIGNETHVGAGATIIQGINVGKASLIGAGSVVVCDVPDRTLMLGIPAKATKNIKDWKKVLVKDTTPILKVLEKIESESTQIALVVDEKNFLLGTVTDGDVRRAIIASLDLNQAVSNVMNKKPVVVKEKVSRAAILELMKRKKVYQIPILDSHGRVIGLELLSNLLL